LLLALWFDIWTICAAVLVLLFTILVCGKLLAISGCLLLAAFLPPVLLCSVGHLGMLELQGF